LDLQTDDDKLEAKGLTAALREHLATAGLMPSPEVPGGAPQTDLLTAVEGSPIPQADWLAAMLRLIPRPRPPSYRLEGTLRQQGSDCPCGVTYWLQETVQGAHTEVNTEWKDGYPAAVRAIASNAYIAITNSAVYVYPRWARWSNREAFDRYNEGLSHLLRSRGRPSRTAAYQEALACHRAAERGEPRNLLPRLQVANIVEKQAAFEQDEAHSRKLRIEAVGKYLEIAEEVPSLVEARYRASVLLSMLAPEAGNLSEEQRSALEQVLPARGMATTDLGERLRNTANEESKAAVKCLGRLSTLRRDRRFRNRFEPKGADRKRLRATIRISRLCQRARQMDEPNSRWERFIVLATQQVYHLRVRTGLIGLGQGTWQIPYNAASLYAVMYGVTPKRTRWREHAFDRLNDVIEDPLADLREDWLVKGDPDLNSLRSLSEWPRVVRRYCRVPQAAIPSSEPGPETPSTGTPSGTPPSGAISAEGSVTTVVGLASWIRRVPRIALMVWESARKLVGQLVARALQWR
jgi:hypothetical protein